MQLEGKTIAITGVGGFIGLRMVERARERGMTVRGIDLNEEGARRARAKGAEVVVGDICSASQVETAVRGADIVFHTAAVVVENGDWELYRRVNVGGTINVARTARGLGVTRFIHLSSVMVYGFTFPANVDEDGPLRGDENPYCQTKIESEQCIMAMHEPGRFEVTAIRPGDVYGPGCPSWVLRPLELLKKHQFAVPDGDLSIMNHVHVDNLIDAIFLAIEKDATSMAFNITDGASTTVRQYFNYIAAMAGQGPVRSIPGPVLLNGVRIIERVAKRLGAKTEVSAPAIRFLARKNGYSIERARSVLGWEPRVGLAQGMAALEGWVRSEGLV